MGTANADVLIVQHANNLGSENGFQLFGFRVGETQVPEDIAVAVDEFRIIC